MPALIYGLRHASSYSNTNSTFHFKEKYKIEFTVVQNKLRLFMSNELFRNNSKFYSKIL